MPEHASGRMQCRKEPIGPAAGLTVDLFPAVGGRLYLYLRIAGMHAPEGMFAKE